MLIVVYALTSARRHHYARAQRQWAFQLARATKWAECIPHFELALAINPLYPGAWFTFGCAAMNVEDWPRAAKAFARVVQLGMCLVILY